jgi:hypothetical protein
MSLIKKDQIEGSKRVQVQNECSYAEMATILPFSIATLCVPLLKMPPVKHNAYILTS